MTSENPTNTERFLQLRSDFTDFEHFQGDPTQRAEEKERFLNNETYVPEYAYPRLANFRFDSDIAQLKSDLLEASFGLKDTIRSSEVSLQIGYIHSELARIALTEAAHYMQTGDYETTSDAFNRRNVEAYGEFDTDLSLSMIHTEYIRTFDLIPASEYEDKIRNELLGLIDITEPGGITEPEILSESEIKALQRFVLEKYKNSFGIVPDTDNSVTYNAGQCRDILEKVLAEDGLAAKGWTIVINEASIIAATYPKQKIIYIPATIAYTADEIRRILIGHEIKAHAWRYENALLTGNQILEEGTSTSADIEEGLGILIECAIAGSLDNPSLDRARDRYITAGLALGVDGVKRDAREVYEVLWRMFVIREALKNPTTTIDEFAAKQVAYTHIENAFRGTSFARKGVIYTKLKIYYEGLVKNADFFREYGDDIQEAFDIAFLGRYDHTDPIERELFRNKRS